MPGVTRRHCRANRLTAPTGISLTKVREMADEAIATVRRFNRTVTQQVGALSEEYLARSRPLGASRLLWEIGKGGTNTRALRTRLDLDSGYLSRLLRRLESEGLIAVEPDADDQRVRTVRLTPKGRSERAVLDRRSDQLARSLLAALDTQRQAQLVTAMATVDRLLSAAAVRIAVEDPSSDDAAWCIRAYFAELDTRFEGGFDPGVSIATDAAGYVEPAGLFVIARLQGDPIGCGALRFHAATEPAEIKRLWVSADARGLGVGRRLLNDLETLAAAHGATVVRLDTNRSLTEAISMYRSAGYREIAAFTHEPYAHHWFEKHLSTAIERDGRPR
jgi:DNA-binding MarR family transcriptional regulator/GNAT superfamily N-acetyltransferase